MKHAPFLHCHACFFSTTVNLAWRTLNLMDRKRRFRACLMQSLRS
jgi:hypothetical protein